MDNYGIIIWSQKYIYCHNSCYFLAYFFENKDSPISNVKGELDRNGTKSELSDSFKLVYGEISIHS